MGSGRLTHFTLPERFKAAMVAHARRELPNECCGLLLSHKGALRRLVPMRSTPAAPDTYFMDPEQQVRVFRQMENRGETLAGIYHSHPKGPVYPSGMDLQLAFHPTAVYVIISLENRALPVIRGFVLKDSGFSEILVRP